MAEEHPTTEWRIPAAAAGAIQLSARLARPANWAMRLADRGRPPLVGAFGAQLVNHFHTIGAPGLLALDHANRFLVGESQAPGGDLPLANQAGVQRAAGSGHWPAFSSAGSASGPPAVARAALALPGHPPVGGPPEPLLGELAAAGWGQPGLIGPSPSPSAAMRPVERHVEASPVPPIARRHEDALPTHAQDQAGGSANISPTPPAPADQAGADRGAPPDPATPPPANGAPIARFAEHPPGDRSASGTVPHIGVPQPSVAERSPNLLTLEPAALRATTFMRSPPPDPLQRMGYAPPLSAPARSPDPGVTRPPLAAPMSRVERRQAPASDHSASVAGTSPVTARQTTPERPLVLARAPAQPDPVRRAPAPPEAGQSADTSVLGAPSTSRISPRGATPQPAEQPGAGFSEPEPTPPPLAQQPPAPATIQAKLAEPPAEAGMPVAAGAPQLTRPSEQTPAGLPGARVVEGAPRVSPLFLSTMLLQRHYSHIGDTSGLPLALLRTSHPTPAARRAFAASGAAQRSGARAGTASPPDVAPGAGAWLAGPRAGTPAQEAASASQAPAWSAQRSFETPTDSAGAASEGDPGEPSIWDEPRAVEIDKPGAQFTWGVPPLLQHSAGPYAMTAQLGAQPLLRRSPALQPIATAAPALAHDAGAAPPPASQNAFTETMRQAYDLPFHSSHFAQPWAEDRGAAPGLLAHTSGSVWMYPAAQRALDTGGNGWPAIAGERDTEPGPGWLPEQRPANGLARSAARDNWEPPDLTFAPRSEVHRQTHEAAFQPAVAAWTNRPTVSPYDGALPALDFAQPRSIVQRAIGDDTATPMPAATASAPAAAGALDGAPAQAAVNIEEIARKVYDHLRRRILIDHERRGR